MTCDVQYSYPSLVYLHLELLARNLAGHDWHGLERTTLKGKTQDMKPQTQDASRQGEMAMN
jgi:hypothetical protein